jgi:hypothetical protein
MVKRLGACTCTVYGILGLYGVRAAQETILTQRCQYQVSARPALDAGIKCSVGRIRESKRLPVAGSLPIRASRGGGGWR